MAFLVPGGPMGLQHVDQGIELELPGAEHDQFLSEGAYYFIVGSYQRTDREAPNRVENAGDASFPKFFERLVKSYKKLLPKLYAWHLLRIRFGTTERAARRISEGHQSGHCIQKRTRHFEGII